MVGTVAGVVIGSLVFVTFIGLGMLLMSRVSSIVPVVIAAIAGAYASWLLGVIVFGAVRGSQPDEQDRQS